MTKQRKAAHKTSKKKSGKKEALSGVGHKHLQTAKLLEDKSTDLLNDLHNVLQKHGFTNASIQSFALRDEPAGNPVADNLCRVWRCHTTDNGTNECGWEWEPCDS